MVVYYLWVIFDSHNVVEYHSPLDSCPTTLIHEQTAVLSVGSPLDGADSSLLCSGVTLIVIVLTSGEALRAQTNAN